MSGEWRTGWTLVLATLLGVVLGAVKLYSAGLFVEPLEQEFGWSRSGIMGGLSLVSFVGILASPLVGVLVDRWGSRRIALPGSILFCAAFAALSFAGPSIWSWWILWLLLAFVSLATNPTVWSAAISSRFFEHRGLAIAVAFCGTGITATFIPVLTNTLIDTFGWRNAYRALGGISFLLVVPALYFFFFDARVKRSRESLNVEPETAPPMAGWTVAQGVRSRQFYQIAAAALLVTSVVIGMNVHLVPMLSESGLARLTVVKIVGLVGIMSIVGRLTVGYLFDHLPGPPIGMISVGLPMISALLILVFPGSLVAAVVAVIVLGLCVGGEYDAVIYLSSRFFGLRNFGTLFGIIASLILAGVGLGPIVGGLVYDISGNYELFLVVVIAMSALASLLMGTLGRYPEHSAT